MPINPNDFSLTVGQLLEDYAENVQEAVAQAVEETGKKALKAVKAKSPIREGKGGGRYKKGWRMKKERSGVFRSQSAVTIYNAADGPLVHLLENGHVIRNVVIAISQQAPRYSPVYWTIEVVVCSQR